MSDEDLYYQLYIAGNNREQMEEFHQKYKNRFNLRKTIVVRNPYCIDDCKHLIMEESIQVRYEQHILFKNWYAKEIISPFHCMKFREVGAWRQNIFSNAYNKSWDEFERRMAGKSKLPSPTRTAAWKAKEKIYQEIISEYINCKMCPFFEK
jgi:hypothetical protein